MVMAVRTVGGFTLPVSVEGELHTPSKDSSCNVRLELKIKRVKHGKEIPFTGADYQEIKDAIDGNEPPFTLAMVLHLRDSVSGSNGTAGTVSIPLANPNVIIVAYDKSCD